MRHPKTRILLTIVLSFCFFAAFYFIYANYGSSSGYYLGNSLTHLEIICYLLLGAINFIVFTYSVSLRTKRFYTRILMNIGFAVFYTAQVILINNYFSYIKFNSAFMWADPIVPYLQFFLSDIAYNTGIGKYRYLIVFSAFLMCALALSFIRRSEMLVKAADNNWIFMPRPFSGKKDEKLRD